MSDTRKTTNLLIELCEEGMLTWESVARECLSAMSEREVANMELTKDTMWARGEEDEDD
jgi:hypothetical protein